MESKVKVWDIYIRFYHWALVALLFANLFITEEDEKPHEIIGYISDFVEETHEAFANTLMVCIGLHATAAVIDSFRHRENLIMSMIHGYKRK